MADTCSDVYAAIARLEAKIDSIPRVDEQSIINKASSNAQAVLKPEIAGIGVVAGGAVITAGGAASAATIAKELADDALRLAAPLVSKIGALAGQVAGLLGRFGNVLLLITNIAATVASYVILQQQIDALKRENQALREYVNAAMSAANEAGSIANAAKARANLGVLKADFAIKETQLIAQTLNKTTALANATAVKADQAINNASIADAKAEQAINGVKSVNTKTDQALSKADAALKLITEAQNLLNSLDAGVRGVHADMINRLGIVFTTLLKLIDEYGQENFYNDASNSERIYYLEKALEAAKRETAAALNLARQALIKANQPTSTTTNTTIATNNSNNALATAQQALSVANLANSKSDIALPTSVTALTTAQKALTRPPVGLTITPSTGITPSKAELTTYINTQVNQSTGLKVEQIKVEFQSGQKTLKEEIIRAINPSAIQAAGITAQQARDEQLRQQPIINGIQSTLATIPASINQVTQQVNQKVNQADLSQSVNNVITQSPTISTLQRDVAQVKTNQINIEAVNTEANSKLDQINTKVSTINANTANNNPAIKEVENLVSSIVPKINDFTKNINNVVNQINLALSKINTLIRQLNSFIQSVNRQLREVLNYLIAAMVILTFLRAAIPTIIANVATMGTRLVGLVRFLAIDRVLNLLNFLANLHNASMLTSSLKITLLEMLGSVGNATGLLQTADGDNVDLNQVFNQGIETLIVGVVGADIYAQMTLSWRKYNPILRAGSNILSNVGNMFSSLGNGVEVIGERTGKIGNSLRAAGVVRENAYNYMSENMSVHTNKFMGFQTKAGGAIEVLEAVNEIAQSVVEGQEAYTESVKATDAFKKTLAEGEKKPGIDADNLAIKAEAEKIKANLVKDPTGEKETGYFSSLTDL